MRAVTRGSIDALSVDSVVASLWTSAADMAKAVNPAPLWQPPRQRLRLMDFTVPIELLSSSSSLAKGCTLNRNTLQAHQRLKKQRINKTHVSVDPLCRAKSLR